MNRMRIMGLALIAVLALAVVASASASAAEPAYYECAKTAKGAGKYEKGCLKEAAAGKGTFEIKEGIGKNHAIKGKSGFAELETPGTGTIVCKTSVNTGTLTSPTHISKIVTTYQGCTTNGKKCTSVGQRAGTIKTNSLEGDLGYIEGGKATHEVGVDIKAEGGAFVEFGCEGVGIKWFGSIIGRYTPVNKFSKESTLSFKRTAKGGTQEVEKLEGQPKDTLEAEFSVAPGQRFATTVEQITKSKGELLDLKA